MTPPRAYREESPAIQAHLGIAQSVIQRMAANSASCKAWCIGLVSAILVVVADKNSPYDAIAAMSGRRVDVDPELFMGLLSGRVVAEEQLAKLPNYLFEWARFFNLYASGLYRLDQPALAADLRHGQMFPERKVENMIWHACADLLTIVRKAMARRAADRYSHAEELADELRRFQAGQLVAAHQFPPKQIGFLGLLLTVGLIAAHHDERRKHRQNPQLRRGAQLLAFFPTE